MPARKTVCGDEFATPTYSQPDAYTSQSPLCLSHTHDTNHLFNCCQIPTQHKTISL